MLLLNIIAFLYPTYYVERFCVVARHLFFYDSGWVPLLFKHSIKNPIRTLKACVGSNNLLLRVVLDKSYGCNVFFKTGFFTPSIGALGLKPAGGFLTSAAGGPAFPGVAGATPAFVLVGAARLTGDAFPWPLRGTPTPKFAFGSSGTWEGKKLAFLINRGVAAVA